MHKKLIIRLNQFITSAVYLTYPLILSILFLTKDERFWRVLLTPAISFLLVSVFRRYINAPRPYELTNSVPIIPKETKGKSFPSRHVFSIFVIATTLFFLSKPLGVFLMAGGSLLAILRVIGGVHFPRDVIAGAAIGILAGILGFYI